MTGEQVELGVMIAGGAIATLVGFGKITLGADTESMRRKVQMLRGLGPLLMVIAGVLLAMSFAR